MRSRLVQIIIAALISGLVSGFAVASFARNHLASPSRKEISALKRKMASLEDTSAELFRKILDRLKKNKATEDDYKELVDAMNSPNSAVQELNKRLVNLDDSCAAIEKRADFSGGLLRAPLGSNEEVAVWPGTTVPISFSAEIAGGVKLDDDISGLTVKRDGKSTLFVTVNDKLSNKGELLLMQLEGGSWYALRIVRAKSKDKALPAATIEIYSTTEESFVCNYALRMALNSRLLSLLKVVKDLAQSSPTPNPPK